MFPHFPRLTHPLFIPDADPAEDITAQLAWLMEQAEAQGYRDINDLVARNGAEFDRLAAAWREHQEAAHLRQPLSATVRTVVTVLGYAKRAVTFVSSLLKRAWGARNWGRGVVTSGA
jgi:hypothetical protein